MGDRKLKTALWVAAVGCWTCIFGVLLPWSWLSGSAGLFGMEIPSGPLTVYAVRACSMLFVFVGVFFALIAGDPRRYAPFLSLGIAGLLIMGVVCLVTGLAVGMWPPWFLTDAAFCFVLGGLMLAWRWRRP